ncbi:arsinothricin resistance N-acetyltransferase ArsN1 family B [Massilia sp. MS-15]|uniref:arsinothricin resistance N-acetyltransferase ArsN1 family B n=1 Tax=Massilia sp. MS-15 TaxID=2878200 RepID=UPI001CD62012|nr:arsinothricin resistance N-acetyltransferase ArsN1 family B [Massilia sp. MS-15]MCA1247450.1 N-acetyltransferase family protein [Massilia sp. MS-15]
MQNFRLRLASAADAASICAIYNLYVATTTITFEEEAVGEQDMAQRIAEVGAASLPWLVLEIDGAVRGYAYATKWRARSAYRHSVESTVYLDQQAAGHGFGRVLYGALLDELRKRELHLVIGGIALPNEASIGLHEALGFSKVAHFSEVGRKFGQWLDVGYWELKLQSMR